MNALLILATLAGGSIVPQQPTTLYSSTSLVLVDVVVTNKGAPAQGPAKPQFTSSKMISRR